MELRTHCWLLITMRLFASIGRRGAMRGLCFPTHVRRGLRMDGAPIFVGIETEPVAISAGSLSSEGLHGIDGGGAQSRGRGGDDGQREHGECGDGERERIKRTDAEEQRAEQA